MSKKSTVTAEPEHDKELVPAKPNPAMPTMFSLTPKDLTEAMAFAKMMSESSLVPKNYQGKDKAGDCLIAMHFANVLGLDVLQAMPDIAVINGRPGIFGTLGKALLRRHSFKIEESDIEVIRKNGMARCKITRPDNSEVIERTFSLEDAKMAKLWGKQGPWTDYWPRQMAWRAFWFAARDGAGDVLRGMWGVEELRDYTDTTAVATEASLAPKELPPPVDVQKIAEQFVETVNKKTGEIIETAAQPAATPEVPKNGLTPDQRKHIVMLMGKFKVEPTQLKKHLFDAYGIIDDKTPTKFVTQDQYGPLCDWIENPQDDLDLGV